MIHRIRIQNFKSLEDVTVELGEVTVLVGRSGAGKTNFVDAVRFLRDVLRGDRSQNPLLQNFNRLSPAWKPKTALAIETKFRVEGIPDLFDYYLEFGKDDWQRVATERLCVGNDAIFEQRNQKWVVEPALVDVPRAGPIALSRIPAIPEVVIAFTALSLGVGCYHFPATVMGEQRQPRAGSRGLDDHASNYIDTYRDVLSNLQDLNVRKSLVATLQRLNPLVSAVELDSLQNPQKVIVGHRSNGKIVSLDLSQESDGFRRFFAHLLALYQRPPKQTLLFEEPENGIYPGALSLLADEFKAAPPAGRGQVVLTTHNPLLLDHFDADQIRVVELDGFRTKIGPLSPEQSQSIREQLLEPGELLTVDPARLADAQPVVSPAR